MRIKPILFNTEMVRAILDGRKAVTRQVIKCRVPLNDWMFYKMHDNRDGAITCGKDKLCAGFYRDEHIFYLHGEKHIDAHFYVSPCKPGDILYVRETWAKGGYRSDGKDWKYYYRADKNNPPLIKWCPSIHMPKEAARIWLKVTDVRVERLQDMTVEDCKKEGAETDEYLDMQEEAGICGIQCETLKHYFAHSIWNSTIKKQDLDKYGWEANPWCFVISFEKIDKSEVLNAQ